MTASHIRSTGLEKDLRTLVRKLIGPAPQFADVEALMRQIRAAAEMLGLADNGDDPEPRAMSTLLQMDPYAIVTTPLYRDLAVGRSLEVLNKLRTI